MQDPTPQPISLSSTRARQKLGKLIKHAQHPSSFVVLKHHGDPVAAIVSMPNLRRIFNAQDIERVIDGTYRPGGFSYTEALRGGNDRETAEAIQRLQIDRLKERELLARQGLQEIPGGEVRFVPASEPVRIGAPVRFWPLAVWWRVRGWFGQVFRAR